MVTEHSAATRDDDPYCGAALMEQPGFRVVAVCEEPVSHRPPHVAYMQLLTSRDGMPHRPVQVEVEWQ